MTIVNNYRIRLDENSKSIELPINTTWDMVGVNDSIEIFENEIIKKIINPIDNFETIRYSHEPWNDSISDNTKTSINYEFYFYNSPADSNITGETNSNNWVSDYRANGLTTSEVYFKDKVLTNSFFKLDFYDSKNVTNQQIYLTIIIPTRQGETLSTTYGRKTVNINKPTFSLDFTGNKEGYFVYWLKSTEFINLSTLYMSAKFFDANSGQFKRLMTKSQGDLIDKFNFNQSDYFYYTVNLNYDNYTYSIYLDTIGGDKNRVGMTSSPIKWYEYVNV